MKMIFGQTKLFGLIFIGTIKNYFINYVMIMVVSLFIYINVFKKMRHYNI